MNNGPRQALAGAFGFEAAGRFVGSKKPPLITRYAAWLMGRNLSYSTAKARTRLGICEATVKALIFPETPKK